MVRHANESCEGVPDSGAAEEASFRERAVRWAGAGLPGVVVSRMMPPPSRSAARALAHESIARGDPLAWFEELYSRAKDDPSAVPWADLGPNPNLVDWLRRQDRPASQDRLRALVVGCGLGDDAEELSRLGYQTTAFDISSSAIELCRRRFPDSRVDYVARDLFAAPASWTHAFELVLEAYALQVLPPELRLRAARAIASFVAVDGTLLVIARARGVEDPVGDAFTRARV